MGADQEEDGKRKLSLKQSSAQELLLKGLAELPEDHVLFDRLMARKMEVIERIARGDKKISRGDWIQIRAAVGIAEIGRKLPGRK